MGRGMGRGMGDRDGPEENEELSCRNSEPISEFLDYTQISMSSRLMELFL
jgi:hypothetical protein